MKRIGLILGIFVILICSYLLIRINFKTEETHTYAIEHYIEYNHLYMGNASNLSQLFHRLPLSEKGLTLEIFPESYSVKINYAVLEEKHLPTLEKQIKYNSIVAFSLIDNLEHITYNFDSQFYSLSRQTVKKWFDLPLRDLLLQHTWDKEVLNKYDDLQFLEKWDGLIKTIR